MHHKKHKRHKGTFLLPFVPFVLFVVKTFLVLFRRLIQIEGAMDGADGFGSVLFIDDH